MTVKRGPKWPWFSALRGPESGLAGKMKQIEAPNRGQNPKEYPRNLGNPPLPRARVRARFTFYRRKIGAGGANREGSATAIRRTAWKQAARHGSTAGSGCRHRHGNGRYARQ